MEKRGDVCFNAEVLGPCGCAAACQTLFSSPTRTNPLAEGFFFELEYSPRSSTNHSAIYHLQHNDDEKRHVKKEKEDVVRVTPP